MLLINSASRNFENNLPKVYCGISWHLLFLSYTPLGGSVALIKSVQARQVERDSQQYPTLAAVSLSQSVAAHSTSQLVHLDTTISLLDCEVRYYYTDALSTTNTEWAFVFQITWVAYSST